LAFGDENGLRLLAHPLYSHEIALPDLFLFGHVTGCLQGMARARPGGLFEARQEFVAEPRPRLFMGFRSLAGETGLSR
jgi:hypothetical protein